MSASYDDKTKTGNVHENEMTYTIVSPKNGYYTVAIVASLGLYIYGFGDKLGTGACHHICVILFDDFNDKFIQIYGMCFVWSRNNRQAGIKLSVLFAAKGYFSQNDIYHVITMDGSDVFQQMRQFRFAENVCAPIRVRSCYVTLLYTFADSWQYKPCLQFQHGNRLSVPKKHFGRSATHIIECNDNAV